MKNFFIFIGLLLLLSSCAPNRPTNDPLTLGTVTPATDGRTMYSERLRASVIEVEFSYTADDEQDIAGFELWCIFVPGSGVQELVATIDDPTIRVWTLETTELPIGIRLPYYMRSVNSDGTVNGWSPNGYQFAVTRAPVIKRLDKLAPAPVDPLSSKVSFVFDYAEKTESTYKYIMYHKKPDGQDTLIGSVYDGSPHAWSGNVLIPDGENSFFFKTFENGSDLGSSNILTYTK